MFKTSTVNLDKPATSQPTELVESDLAKVQGGRSGDSDDRPTEEVAFYYNKIAFSY